MKATTSFAWASLVCSLVGSVLTSYAGSFFFYALAVAVALVPVLFGKWMVRVFAVVLLMVSLALLVQVFPKFNAEMTRYRGNENSPSIPRV